MLAPLLQFAQWLEREEKKETYFAEKQIQEFVLLCGTRAESRLGGVMSKTALEHARKSTVVVPAALKDGTCTMQRTSNYHPWPSELTLRINKDLAALKNVF